MKTVRKTRSGWVWSRTDMRHGCVVEGGIAGAEYLFRKSTLEKFGLSMDSDPHAYDVCGFGTTNIDYLSSVIWPDKILKRGHIIH